MSVNSPNGRLGTELPNLGIWGQKQVCAQFRRTIGQTMVFGYGTWATGLPDGPVWVSGRFIFMGAQGRSHEILEGDDP